MYDVILTVWNENNNWHLHDLLRMINMKINILEIVSKNPYTFPDVNEHNSISLFHTFVKGKQITNSHSNKPIKSKTRKPSITCVFWEHDHYSTEFKNIPESVARFNIENRNSFCLIVW